MRKSLVQGSLVMAVSLSCCNQQSFVGDSTGKFQNTENGLEYKVHQSAGKRTVQFKDAVVFHVKMTNGEKVMRDTYKEGIPINMVLDNSPFKGSLEEGLTMLAEGDSATFMINADSLYAKSFNQPLPADIEKGSKIKFDVKVEQVIPRSELEKDQEIVELRTKLSNEEEINYYLRKNKLNDAEKQLSGIYIVRKNKKGGAKLEKGQKVAVHYTGRLLSGLVFDNSYAKQEPIVFTIGKGEVIKGWDLAMEQLSVGEKATILIPSYLAYGEEGAGTIIPPNSPLAFDVEIVSIK